MAHRFQLAANNMNGTNYPFDWPPVLAEATTAIPARPQAPPPPGGLPRTRAQAIAAAMTHIEQVFEVDFTDATNELVMWMNHANIRTPTNMIELTDEQIDKTKYPDATAVHVFLSPVYKSLLKAFRNYCIVYETEAANPDPTVMTPQIEFLSIDPAHFNYWKRAHFMPGSTGLQNLAIY